MKSLKLNQKGFIWQKNFTSLKWISGCWYNEDTGIVWKIIRMTFRTNFYLKWQTLSDPRNEKWMESFSWFSLCYMEKIYNISIVCRMFLSPPCLSEPQISFIPPNSREWSNSPHCDHWNSPTFGTLHQAKITTSCWTPGLCRKVL